MRKEQKMIDQLKQKQSLEMLAGPKRKLMNKLVWKFKLLDGIPMQAHQQMQDPEIKAFIIAQISPEI
jgi:hypothetical protein